MKGSELPPILKHRNSDFLVSENIVSDCVSGAVGEYDYFRLRKSGYTTFAALGEMASYYSIESSRIGYAGLKDEDGVTEQLISVPAGIVNDVALFNRRASGEDRWLVLQFAGSGAMPMQVGRLNGNGFRIVVRNLDRETATRFSSRRSFQHLFLNYYDTQRFGVPEGPKQTHLIGRSILSGNWESARRLLIESRSPEAAVALSFQGNPEDLFHSLDGRVVAFYCSAAASADWNAQLAAKVSETCGRADTLVDQRHGIDYLFVANRDRTTELMSNSPEFDYLRYRWDGSAVTADKAARATVVQTFVQVNDLHEDEHFNERWRITLNFFLPSGCYATMAVRQMFVML